LIQAIADSDMGDDERRKLSEQEVRFRKYQLPALSRLFSAVSGKGVIFSHNGTVPHVLGDPEEEGISPEIPNQGFADQMIESNISAGDPCTFDAVLTSCETFMSNRLNGSGAKLAAARTVLGAGSTPQSGILACFPLEHCLGAGSGNIPQVFRELMGDSEAMFGKLRLWLRFHELRPVEGAAAGARDAESVSFQLCMGITSDFAQFGDEEVEVTGDDGSIRIETKRTMVYLAINDVDNYITSSFTEGDDRRGWDSGNLTKEDGIFYDKLFSQALNSRTGVLETE
jgi:hypothetical protein